MLHVGALREIIADSKALREAAYCRSVENFRFLIAKADLCLMSYGCLSLGVMEGSEVDRSAEDSVIGDYGLRFHYWGMSLILCSDKCNRDDNVASLGGIRTTCP